jgi:hypothetical protein
MTPEKMRKVRAPGEELKEEVFVREGRRAALRIHGVPYLVWWTGSFWDCRPLVGDEIPGFEEAERKYAAERPRIIAEVLELKEKVRRAEEARARAAGRKVEHDGD